ncbi:ACR3 family arsenite efflux transporter [Patescibacteria group bacterium]|nr:ACR3 family arsenite efflux transporter [Patescibacteria group bacterium]
MSEKDKKLGFFERYLTLWVLACIITGIAIGELAPSFPGWLSRFEYAQVSIPVAVLIWLMIYPMMVQIDFKNVLNVWNKPEGLALTLTVNWIIKPFTMFAFAYIFFKVIFAGLIAPALAEEYLAGAILLGAAPCTAMVFVWSYLTRGDANYTLVQVSVNDLILVFAYAPIVMFLLGLTEISVPYDTILFSVILYIVIPLTAGYVSREILVSKRGKDWFEEKFVKNLKKVTISGLLLTLVILFSFQGEIILENPLHIILIGIPLAIQTLFIFTLAYSWAKLWRLPHNIAAPAAMIGASNFFELAVAVAISLFGLSSGAALATVVGVLIEVPIMLFLVSIANKTRHWFPK